MRWIGCLGLIVLGGFAGCVEGDDTTIVQNVTAAPPVLTGIAPASGPAAGGTTITLSGTAFVSGATVTMGATVVPAGNVTFVSSVELTVVTPAGSPGPATVLVTNPDGAAGSLVGGFTFVGAPPVLSSILPQQGVSTGGTVVTLSGSGFTAGATATIGGIPLLSPVVSGTTTLTATTPNLGATPAGALNVTVWNSDGTSSTLTAAFTALGGALVPGFGTSGVVTVNPSAGTDEARAAVNDGTHFYIGGYAHNGTSWEWRIEKRLMTTGVLDANFGTSGVVTSDPTSGNDWCLALTHDGNNLYAAGYDNNNSRQWRVEKRLLSTGTLVTGFGTGGVLTISAASSTGECHAIVHDGTNLYLGGTDWVAGGNFGARIEKRLMSTGALVTGFGTNGVVLPHSSSFQDIVRGLALDGTHLYSVADASAGASDQWRIEKRLLTTGALDNNFGVGGIVTTDPGVNHDYPYAVVLSGGSLYIAGEVNRFLGSPTVDSHARVEKRSALSGALDGSFGTGGVVTIDPTTAEDRALAITLGAGGAFYVGGQENQGGGGWTEKRSTATGALVNSFGTGGRVTFQANNAGSVHALSFSTGGLLLAGADGTSNGQWHLELRAP